MIRFRAFFFALVILVSGGCVSNQPLTSAKIEPPSYPALLPITILHTNDVHGHCWAEEGKDGVARGGFAAQAKLIDKIWREVDAKGGVTFLLSGGDINTGVPESDLLEGEPDIVAMSRIGYDAMVLGNHEFDRGVEKIHRQMRIANFPFLSANILNADGTFLAIPTLVIDRGVRLGIIGLTTNDLPVLVSPELVKNLKVGNPITAAKDFLPRLREEKVDIVVALTHMGILDSSLPEAVVMRKDFIDDRMLAEAVPDIDVIIGGHSHTALHEGVRVGRTLIAQAGGHGQYLGRVDLLWDANNRRILSATATLLPILPEQGEDKQIAGLMDDFRKKAGTLLDEAIAVTEVHLDGSRDEVRARETNLGNLISDAIREATDADVAVYNGSGIRAGIDKGPITMRDLYTVLPFSNTAVSATITGAQLKATLEAGLRHRHLTGSFLQVSGMTFRASGDVVTEIRVAGKPVSPGARLRLATNNFLLAGGDRFEILRETTEKRDTGIPVERVVASYLKRVGTIRPTVEGRITLTAPSVSE